MIRAHVLLALAALALASCRERRKEEAERAVRTYLDRVIEAYRTADESLVDPLVSEEHGLRLVGLIGVKVDAGVVLDAKLLELKFVRVEPEGDGWAVETQERWYYQDRKKTTGIQVGPDSTDAYGIRYHFARKDGKLILQSTEFVGEPQVGRKTAPVPTQPRVFHGMPAQEGSR